MVENNTLFTAFYGTSASQMLELQKSCEKLILPNDRIRDSQILIDAISKENYDYVVSFGQKPVIKNKIYIETTAKDRESRIDTNFNYDILKRLWEQNGLDVRISHNAGTSFCNQLYLNTLKYIMQSNAKTQMIFIHIPFEKNITDRNHFYKNIMAVFAGNQRPADVL